VKGRDETGKRREGRDREEEGGKRQGREGRKEREAERMKKVLIIITLDVGEGPDIYLTRKRQT